MTDKEKAKAYDEALERARKMLNMILNNELLGFPDQIREIFPQLCESKDERIRKEIISALKFANDGGVYNEHIAYLEKQKPADLSEMMVHKEPCIAPVPTPMVADEQKPMEWSEEDENLLKIVTSDVARMMRKCGVGTNEWNVRSKAIQWIESLPERFNLQPKKEQSEYDENMDKECIKLCNTLNSIPSVNTFESCCGHLKDRYSVWFFCNDTVAISRLGRSVDRNYSDGKWELVVDSTDTHPTGVFWLRSKVPFQSYDEMEESVNELCVCIQYWFNTKFDSYFNDDACK